MLMPLHSCVVATMPGSLPMGGSVPDTPIHALLQAPPPLDGSDGVALQPRRTDIDLGEPGRIAFLIEDVVSPAEADAMVRISEQMGYRDEAPGIRTAPGMRINKALHWVAPAALMDAIHRRIAPLLPARIDGDALHPRLSHRLNMYRYDDLDVFNRHVDGDWPGFSLSDDGRSMLEWAGPRSKLSMLLYLNGAADGVQGGATRLHRADGGVVEVTPKKGAALFFRHGFGPHSVLHEGARVHGPVAKYVVRINVMYEG